MDEKRAKEFMSTMIGFVNGGSLAMMCSIGHRTGLFDAMEGVSPLTATEVAVTAGLNERYVREWLAAMAAGGVVDYHDTDQTFQLPAEHQALVARSGGPLNLANVAQTIALLGKVEDDVVAAFATGDGVPYSRYPGFQALMAEQSAARYDASLVDEVVPDVLGAVDALEEGAQVADVGCGHGHALLLLAARWPRSRFVGYDISSAACETARAAAQSAELSNVQFVARDAAYLAETDRFDFITSFDAIHDQAHPVDVLAAIYQALVPGGKYLCVEPKADSDLIANLEEPMAPYLYTVSTMHCMSVSLAEGGAGLGTAWGRQRTVQYLGEVGFEDVRVHQGEFDRANTHFVATKAS